MNEAGGDKLLLVPIWANQDHYETSLAEQARLAKLSSRYIKELLTVINRIALAAAREP